MIGRPRWVLATIVAAIALTSQAANAQRRASYSNLDALMRRYWIAAVNRDTAELDSLIVGEQPRVVLGFFLEGSGAVSRADAEQVISRRSPPMKALADTVWRTYAVRVGDMPHDWLDYMARFERHCGRWRIAAISNVQKLR
jgi:hypothetical protein